MGRHIRYDLEYITAAAKDLEEYLLSQVLFWPLSGAKGESLQGDSAQLTPGNLLLSLKRVKYFNWPPEDAAILAKAEKAIAQILERWQSNWSKKAQEDFKKRLALWSDYLEGMASAPQSLRGDYAYNIRLRVILELLAEQPGLDHLRASLANLDQRLRSLVTSGEFVWEEDLRSGFPQDQFWFLYANPAGRKK